MLVPGNFDEQPRKLRELLAHVIFSVLTAGDKAPAPLARSMGVTDIATTVEAAPDLDVSGKSWLWQR
jgi:hypothetical protein